MAGYVPEHDDYAALIYRIGMQVSGTFMSAETRLLTEIARRLALGMSDQPDLVEQLATIRQLEAFAKDATLGLNRSWAEDLIAQAAQQGAASVATSMLPRVPGAGVLTDSHVLAATLVAFDLGNAFEDMRARILRYPRDAMGNFLVGGDIYQQVVANNVTQALLGGSSRQARLDALQEFLAKGVTGFRDVAGKNWRIGTYSEMATRTSVARAYTDARVFRAETLGIEYFSILGGRNSCDHCAQWFGKILASRGPAGPREVLHATEDRTIVITVAGTLDDWRASGAGHPNCTCVPVTYLPGLSIPVAASAYDPEAHAARDRLRELEVRERDAKRRLAIATAAGDRGKAIAQQRRILATQKEEREHVAATGQARRYERAQVRFADGIRPSTGVHDLTLPRVQRADRVAPHVPEGLKVLPHELATADRLADVGLHVRFRELDNRPHVKNIDVTISGDLWELKSPTGTGPSTISNQLHRAKEQGARRVVVDGTRTTLSDGAVLAELRRRFAANEWFLSIIHIASDGTVTRISRPPA